MLSFNYYLLKYLILIILTVLFSFLVTLIGTVFIEVILICASQICENYLFIKTESNVRFSLCLFFLLLSILTWNKEITNFFWVYYYFYQRFVDLSAVNPLGSRIWRCSNFVLFLCSRSEWVTWLQHVIWHHLNI